MDLMIRGSLMCQYSMVPDVDVLLGDTDRVYSVSNITEDATTLTSSLAAQAVPWSEVAGSYDLDFGHAISIPQAHRLKQRGLWGDAGHFLTGNLNDTSETISFNISAGQQGQRTNIYTDSE